MSSPLDPVSRVTAAGRVPLAPEDTSCPRCGLSGPRLSLLTAFCRYWECPCGHHWTEPTARAAANRAH